MQQVNLLLRRTGGISPPENKGSVLVRGGSVAGSV